MTRAELIERAREVVSLEEALNEYRLCCLSKQTVIHERCRDCQLFVGVVREWTLCDLFSEAETPKDLLAEARASRKGEEMSLYQVELRPVKYRRNGQDAIGYQSFVDGKMVFDGSSLTTAILTAGEVMLKLQREKQEAWEKAIADELRGR